jgi:Clp amino terminal domain, pathogenicity island component
LNRLVRRGPRSCEPAGRKSGPGTDLFLTDHFLVAREAMSFEEEEEAAAAAAAAEEEEEEEEEARALGHRYLGTEHVLLNLLRSVELGVGF